MPRNNSFWGFWSRLNKWDYTITGSVSSVISLCLIPLALAYPPFWGLVVGIPLFVGGVTLLFTKLSQFFLKKQNIQPIAPNVNPIEKSNSNQHDTPVPSNENDPNKASKPSEYATPIAPIPFEVEPLMPSPIIANENEFSEHGLPPSLPTTELVRYNPRADVLDDDHDFIKINASDFRAYDIAGFSLEKVLEMCLLSKISYGKTDEQLHQSGYPTTQDLRDQGYEVIHFANDYEHAGTIFLKGSTIKIAYNGTKSKGNLITDVNALFATSHFLPDGGRNHCGFYRSFKDSWKVVHRIIEQHAKIQNTEPKNLNYELTGHSMGGAVATIAALCIHKTINAKNISVATFGAPRVFDLMASNIYKEALGKSTLRVTQHRCDPVPASAPGLFGYAHAGLQLRLNKYDGIAVHKIDGYYRALKELSPFDFVSNNSSSIFYYPIRALLYLNHATLGLTHHYLSSLKRGVFGHDDWSSPKPDEQKAEVAPTPQ